MQALLLSVTKAGDELLLLFEEDGDLVLVVVVDSLGELLAERLDLLLELLLALLVLLVDAVLVNDDTLELLNLILGLFELAVLGSQIILHLSVV